MTRSDQSSYGDVHAEIYDALFDDRDDLAVVGDFLAALAGSGALLEFGLGTGRVALPLAARGHRVYGVDNSDAMLAKLRDKPGGEKIETRLGSIAEAGFARTDDVFAVVFCVFSTLYLVTSQEGQLAVFANAARHLPIGGKFVVEGFVHDRRRFLHDQEVVTNRVTDGEVEIRAAKLDAATQTISTSRMILSPKGVVMFPNRLRFVHPSEMDLMARLHGLVLRGRFADWDKAPFTADSGNQVVVYEKVHDAA